MENFRNEVDGLRRRLRLQTLMSVGVLVILMFAMGGADTVARTLVEAPAWKVLTKNGSGLPTERLVITTDVNTARIQVINANIELAQQNPLPASGVTEGTIGYDVLAHKLKFHNGSGWVEAGAGGGGGGITTEIDTWRLEWWMTNYVLLKGIGEGGLGKITVNGAQLNIPAGGVALSAPQVANTLYYVYAYSNAGTAALELSSSVAPTLAQYGAYSNKTNDPSRRFVGMAWMGPSLLFSADMVRSVKNEQGYAFRKKHAPASAVEPFTSSTSWVDLDANVAFNGLFFDGERVNIWTMAMNYVSPNWTTRECRLGLHFGGFNIDDSESGVTINRGLNSYSLPFSVQRAESYVTVTGGAGVKLIKALHRGTSGGASDFYISSSYPASIGFAVMR